MNTIVYVGWGSLLWNSDDLPVVGIWEKTDFKLPVEFSRISDLGRGRLTLVIDEKNGTLNNIWYIKTKASLNESIKRLRRRESTTKSNVSYINLKSKKKRINNTPSSAVAIIEQWAKKNKIDAVIWTSLTSNWKVVRGVEYSCEDAYKYYLESTDEKQRQILDYIVLAEKVGEIRTKCMKTFLKH